MEVEHLWEFRSRLVVTGLLRNVLRALRKNPLRIFYEHHKWPVGDHELIIGALLRI